MTNLQANFLSNKRKGEEELSQMSLKISLNRSETRLKRIWIWKGVGRQTDISFI